MESTDVVKLDLWEEMAGQNLVFRLDAIGDLFMKTLASESMGESLGQ